MFKKWRQVAMVGMALTLVSIPSMSFADTKPMPEKLGNGPRIEGRLEKGTRDRKGERPEMKEEHRARLTETITQYAPELLGTFEAFWNDHDALHTSLMAEKDRIAEAEKEASIAFMDGIREKVTAGTLTREEAKVEIEAYKSTVRATRDARRTQIEALKSMDISETVKKEMHDALINAIESEDAAAVVEALNAMISTHAQHLSFDQAKLELLKTF